MAVKIIAHRGLHVTHPEMSGPAYEDAVALPIHGVECDVRLSSDGKLVLLHDPVLSRVTDGRGRVSKKTLAELEQFHLGAPTAHEKVLTLDEFLDIVVARDDCHAYIEPKHPQKFGRMLEEQLVLRLRHRNLLDDPRIHVISFNASSILRMHQLAPQVDRIHLRASWTKYVYPFDPSFGNPTGRGLSVARARRVPSLIGRRGLPTYVWTVDKPDDMLFLQEHGVEMMATDDPELAIQVLGANTTDD